jgi:protein TonB
MKRFLIPMGFALLLHGLLLSMDPGWMKKKSAPLFRSQHIALALSYRQPKTVSPKPKKPPEDIQRNAVPSPKKETKERAKPKPTKKITKILQTKFKRLFREVKRPTKKTKPQQPLPEKKIPVKVTRTEMAPLKQEYPLEQPAPDIYEEFSDLYMARDEQQTQIASLPDKTDVVSTPPAETIREATPIYRINPPPKYPRIARRRGHQGTVVLEVLVNQEGRVGDLRLLKSSGHPVLDRTAMASVKNWLFEPGLRGDKKVEMWVRVPIKFQLN